jgi:hypothetical protein
MSFRTCYKYILTALSSVLIFTAVKAQEINKKDLINKNWRILAMKCPEALANSSDPDQYVHYWGTLQLTPSQGEATNYGTYVKVTRDASDNPVEKGTYSLVTDENGGTQLILKPRKGDEVTYHIDFLSENYLTLVNLSENAKCKVSYAIAP